MSTRKSKVALQPATSAASGSRKAAVMSRPSTRSQGMELRSRVIPLPALACGRSTSCDRATVPARRGRSAQTNNTAGRNCSQLVVSASVQESDARREANARTTGRAEAKARSSPAKRTRACSAAVCRSARMSLPKLNVNMRRNLRHEQRISTDVPSSNRTAVKTASRAVKQGVRASKSSQVDEEPLVLLELETGSLEKTPQLDQSPQCSLRPLPCPLAVDCECQWEGILSETVDHISKTHHFRDQKTGPHGVIVVKNWKKPGPMQWVTLQTCLGQDFLVMLLKRERNSFFEFFGLVYVLSHQEDADRYEYRMTLKTPEKSARVFSYSTVIRSLYDGNSALDEHDCFVFDTSHAEIFSLEDTFILDVSISVMKI